MVETTIPGVTLMDMFCNATSFKYLSWTWQVRECGATERLLDEEKQGNKRRRTLLLWTYLHWVSRRPRSLAVKQVYSRHIIRKLMPFWPCLTKKLSSWSAVRQDVSQFLHCRIHWSSKQLCVFGRVIELFAAVTFQTLGFNFLEKWTKGN